MIAESTQTPAQTTSLAAPIAHSLRRTRAIAPGGSLGNAAALMRSNGAPLLPVVEDGFPVGVVTEGSLLAALAAGHDLGSDVAVATVEPLQLPSTASGANALRQLSENPSQEGIVVVDVQGKLLGILLPSDIFPKPPVRLRPPAMGGMATPFGVYLTTGGVSAGPPWWALASSGAILVTLLTVARLVTVAGTPLLNRFHLSPDSLDNVQAVISLLIFAVLIHAIPLSGIHAAEHQVVNAVERDEPLTLEVVSRMSRVHPRCGTNFATGAFLLGLATVDWGLPARYLNLQLLFGVVFTLIFWRRLGSLAQYFVTTRPATPKQIQMGIDSAEALLEKYAQAPVQSPTFFQRIWSSGIVYTALGGMVTGWAYALIFYSIGHLEWFGM